MSIKQSYTVIAPFYDLVVRALGFERARRASLQPLHEADARHVLIDGVGTGLDLPFLPPSHRYVALDLTRAMLQRARPRTGELDVRWVQGNSEGLPFPAESFDFVVLHLIVAVVPHPDRALAEAARVVRSGGTLLVFDKFLPPGEPAPWRRLLNPIASRIATRTDVVFEDVLARVTGLRIVSDEPALAGGWFRLIRLRKD
jgi:phosphatidylethanolamine/phosphatidyl-N-methylethanolamine N-methyltransferase